MKNSLCFKIYFFLFFLSLLIILPEKSFAQIKDPSTIKFKIFYPPTTIPTQKVSPTNPLITGIPIITPTLTPLGCPKIANEAKIVTSALERGFWNYFNKSTLYPETWNQVLYKLHPNVCLDDAHTYPPGCTGTRPGAFDMFWCTWTPMKSYLRAGLYMPQDLYSTITLKPWFQSQARYLPGDTTYNQIPIGSVIFFRLRSYIPTKHVAIATNVNQDFVTIFESNGYNITRGLTVGLDGKIQDVADIVVDGFGTPPASC